MIKHELMNMFCHTIDPTNVQRTKICEYARYANMKLLLASLTAIASFKNWPIEHDWSEIMDAGDITHLAPPFIRTSLCRPL